MIWAAVIVPGLLAFALLLWGFGSLKRKRLIENVPTSKVKGVFMGLNEVKGEAVRDDPLTSYLAEAPCVYYAYSIAEHWQRTETYTDGEGKTKTRTVSGWTTVDQGEILSPFDLRDETGRLRIVPDRAEVEADEAMSTTCGRMSALYYGKGPASAVGNSTHRRRFTESIIGLGARIYVMGMARLREDVVQPEIAHDKSAELFLISTRGEKQITRGYAIGAFFKLLFGAIFAFSAPIVYGAVKREDLEAAFWALYPVGLYVAAGYGGAIFLYCLTLLYNGLISVRKRMEMAKSMIDVQLRRRHVLIPRLVACVKGAAAHERETHERVAGMRVGTARATLVAVAESYPDLKTNENFGKLHEDLVDTEDRIALAREFFNGTVTAFNGRIQTMPDVMVAKLARVKPVSYLE